MTWAKD